MLRLRKYKQKLFLYLIYLYTISYLTFLLILPVVYESNRLRPILPKMPGNLVLSVGYFTGVIITFILSIISIQGTKYFSGLLITFVLLGSIYINRFNVLYNEFIRIPPYNVIEPGNLLSLGNKHWKREIPFKILNSVYGQYLLHNVIVNPNITNIKVLQGVEGFGLNLIKSSSVPDKINRVQFTRIKNNGELEYNGFWHNDVEYLLYKVNEGTEDILLTTYDEKVIFIPISLIIK